MEKLHTGAFASRYVIVYKNKLPVFISYFQVVDFTADMFGGLLESQISDLRSKRIKLFDKYLDKHRDKVMMRLVTCGNNFISGEHAFAYTSVSRAQAFETLNLVTEVVSKEEKLRGTISATLVKDFYTESLPEETSPEENKFIRFTVEPNMIVEVPQETKSLEDYIATFSKKYRKRARDIFKAGSILIKKDLSWQQVQSHCDELYKLYNHVFSHAKFKLVKLADGYFCEMKKQFPDEFFVTGYYLENKLVGFDSGFIMPGDTLEAHYIGLDYEINKEHELYQNILYHFIEKAIQYKKTKVDLGRTASEIKSTVGAKAHELVCYIKPQNTVSKVILKPFMAFLQPSEWVPRNPFKED